MIFDSRDVKVMQSSAMTAAGAITKGSLVPEDAQSFIVGLIVAASGTYTLDVVVQAKAKTAGASLIPMPGQRIQLAVHNTVPTASHPDDMNYAKVTDGAGKVQVPFYDTSLVEIKLPHRLRNEALEMALVLTSSAAGTMVFMVLGENPVT